MVTITRRTVLQGAVAAGAISLVAGGSAIAAQPKVRQSVFSDEGRKALTSYAKAVAIMRDRSLKDPSDPLGWTYQYKMHWYPDRGDGLVLADGSTDWAALQRAQVDELDSFFGAAAPGNEKRRQAEATWGKCPHSDSSTLALDFLPWHRKYLFFFERIVRTLSEDEDFALPYWGYMDGRSSQVLPREFDELGSPLSHDRSPKSRQGDPLTSSYFAGRFWSDRQFPLLSRAVEGQPHGGVHVFVGEADRDMSSLFRSSRDPVFWIHHCEIDRIWEGALMAGFPTPTGPWLNNTHRFFDETGKFVELTNEQVLKADQIKDWTGYAYHLVPKPPGGPTSALVAAATAGGMRSTLATATNIPVRSGLQTTLLVAGAPMATAMVEPVAPDGPRRFRLELSEVALDRRAVASVALYLNAPADAIGEALRKYEVGVISTFGMMPGPGAPHADHTSSRVANVLSFDVTEVIAELQREGRWTGEPRLTTAEIDGSLGDAVLTLGRVELVVTTLP